MEPFAEAVHSARLMRALNPGLWIALARREIVPIALLLGIALPLLAFIEIADEVTEGKGEVRWFCLC
jgi:hypothetical protein